MAKGRFGDLIKYDLGNRKIHHIWPLILVLFWWFTRFFTKHSGNTGHRGPERKMRLQGVLGKQGFRVGIFIAIYMRFFFPKSAYFMGKRPSNSWIDVHYVPQLVNIFKYNYRFKIRGYIRYFKSWLTARALHHPFAKKAKKKKI